MWILPRSRSHEGVLGCKRVFGIMSAKSGTRLWISRVTWTTKHTEIERRNRIVSGAPLDTGGIGEDGDRSYRIFAMMGFRKHHARRRALAQKARFATVHLLRFPQITTAEQLALTHAPSGSMSWKIGPGGQVGPDGRRLPSDTWSAVGLFAGLAEAELAFLTGDNS
jgi:hypothetical protein